MTPKQCHQWSCSSLSLLLLPLCHHSDCPSRQQKEQMQFKPSILFINPSQIVMYFIYIRRLIFSLLTYLTVTKDYMSICPRPLSSLLEHGGWGSCKHHTGRAAAQASLRSSLEMWVSNSCFSFGLEPELHSKTRKHSTHIQLHLTTTSLFQVLTHIL